MHIKSTYIVLNTPNWNSCCIYFLYKRTFPPFSWLRHCKIWCRSDPGTSVDYILAKIEYPWKLSINYKSCILFSRNWAFNIEPCYEEVSSTLLCKSSLQHPDLHKIKSIAISVFQHLHREYYLDDVPSFWRQYLTFIEKGTI